MKQLGNRLRALRESIGISQAKFADVIGSTQSSINRYENGQATPTVELLRKYADYFDVSMDYIFARCDEPQGKLYQAKPPVGEGNPELAQFVEMCFDPSSPMNDKLKKTLITNAWRGENMSKELTPKTGQFDEIISIIDNARTRALKAVNAELIQMYWNVGEYLSSLCANSGFGDKVIDEVAAYIAETNPGVKGFNRRGLYRMKQFYETYKDDEFVTPLVTQISWTNHLLIMSGSKSAEERHFYMSLCAKEHYSKRELERQMDSAYYERYMLSSKKLIPESVPQDVRGSILDTYVLEFLDLPEQYSERNLRKAITGNLKQFILEFGKDFTFIGEEYRVQVGEQDFYIDLLFYNRALSCLVPIELKIGKFKPEHIGQINFYLEALDRDVKKPNENPSVGVILCAGKDDAVVEYALSRSMSPTLVSDYTLHLPDKKLLQNKLRELTELALESGEGDEE